MSRNVHRTIHLLDIENLLGTARPTRDEVRACRRSYLDLVGPGAEDHLVIACNHGAILEVGLAWPGPRLVARSGVDGADQALLDVIDTEAVEQRFQSVVIASGDGIFADAAAALASAGVAVVIVSRTPALSRRLRLAAQRVCYFDAPAYGAEAA